MLGLFLLALFASGCWTALKIMELLKTPKRLATATDVETMGAQVWRAIRQIGLCSGTTLANRQKSSWCFLCRDQQVEERCQTEFWDKQPGLAERIQKDAEKTGRTDEEQWRNFAEHWNKLQSGKGTITLSDNPSYDCAKIDYWLDRLFKRDPMRYGPGTSYRVVTDPIEQLKHLPARDLIKRSARAIVDHTHWAPDDAEQIYAVHMLTEPCILLRRWHDWVIDAAGTWTIIALLPMVWPGCACPQNSGTLDVFAVIIVFPIVVLVDRLFPRVMRRMYRRTK